MKASCDLIDKMGGDIVGITVLIELSFLPGRKLVSGHGNVHAVLTYDSE